MATINKRIFVHKKNVARAYLAGLIDGDGSIFVCRGIRKKYDDQFILRVKVVTIDLDTVRFIQDRFGGMCNQYNGLYHIFWHCNNAKILLSKIDRYLILKKEQAKLALQTQETSSSQNEQVFREMRRLNSDKSRFLVNSQIQQRLFWAYLSGLIDSDGCISIKHYQSRNQYLHLKITQKNRNLLDIVKAKIGYGKVYQTQDWFDLEWRNAEANRILRKIEKWLIVKQEKARNGLRFFENKNLAVQETKRRKSHYLR